MIGGDDCMDTGGTSPWMGEGRIMQEQLSRVTHGAVTEGGIDSPLNGLLLRGDVALLRRPAPALRAGWSNPAWALTHPC